MIRDRMQKVVSLKGPQSSMQRIKVSAACYQTKKKAQHPSPVNSQNLNICKDHQSVDGWIHGMHDEIGFTHLA